MRIWLKTVSRSWAKVVALLASPDVVNLWQVGAHRAWRGPVPGDLVLFRPRKAGRAVAGYGRFVATTVHAPQEAWDLFGFSNGAWSFDGFKAQIERRASGADFDTLELANALLSDPVFFPPLNPYDLPDSFLASPNAAPLCPALSRAGRVLIRGLRTHAGRSLVFGDTPQARLLGYRIYRVPGTVVRVDDRALRSVLSELSGHRCAVSREPVRATLEAAHAWPLQYGGPDDLGNRLLLAATPHDLWDNGIIGVDEAHRIIVSDTIRLYGPDAAARHYAGRPLRRRTSGPPYPDEANLRWHRDHLFRWPKYEP